MVNQNIEQLLQQAVDQSMAQTQESRDLAEEVAGKMGDIDSKVNQKMSEMDTKITQATGDIEAAIQGKVDIVLFVDSSEGTPEGSGTQLDPLDTVESAFKKIISGTNSLIYLTGDGCRYVLNEKVIADNVTVAFKSYRANGTPPVLTHSAKKNGDNIEAKSFLLKGGSNFQFFGVDVETCRWQDWVSSGVPVNYISALFGTHSNGVTGGRVTFYSSNITLNNSALFQQHASGTIGWLDTIAIVYSSVTKRDLSNDLITNGFQYLVDQYGTANLPFDLEIISLSLNGGITLPELIGPLVGKDNIRSTVPLTA
ncbi:hypothetical protein [Vibrio sp. 10N.261.51.F12]|uniref:hypothetical protein n=1 Tax=Vibrio sp. 10N.261.51.F12 TaxID=3229679 RepID=UPI00355128A3